MATFYVFSWGSPLMDRDFTILLFGVPSSVDPSVSVSFYSYVLLDHSLVLELSRVAIGILLGWSGAILYKGVGKVWQSTKVLVPFSVTLVSFSV